MKNLCFCAILLALCVFVAGVRLSMLQKSSEPNGLDGYFYALQAKSLVETGRLENPSSQIGYYLCGACAFLAKDAITGVKVWSAVSSAGISLAVFLLIFALTGRSFLSLLGFLLASSSPTVTSLGINYINNQTGVCFLLLYSASLALLSRRRFSLNRRTVLLFLLSVLLFALSALSHKVTLVFACALSLIVCVPKICSFVKQKIVRNLPFALRLALSVFAFVFVLALSFLAFRFFRLHSPRFVHAFDYPSLPILFHKALINAAGLGAIEMSVYAPLLYLLAILAFFKKIPNRHLLLLVPIVYFPFWNLDRDMGIRMWLNAVPLGIPLVLYLFHLLAQKKSNRAVMPSAREQTTENARTGHFDRLNDRIICVVCLILFAVLFFTPRAYYPEHDPPYLYYKTVVSSIELDSDSLLIAHLGLNHVYTYEKGLKDALNWLPNFPVPAEKLWRLAYGANEIRIRSLLSKKELSLADSESLIRKIDGNYTLIREDLWQSYLSREDERIARTFENWYNPHEVRPDYIRRARKVK